MLSKKRACLKQESLATGFVHDLSIRDMLTATFLPRERCRHPAWNTVAAPRDQGRPPVLAMGNKGADADSVLVTR